MAKQTIIVKDAIFGLQSEADNSADLVFFDPPYNMGFEYENHNDNMAPHKFVEWTASWMEQAKRIVKPDGSIWILIPDEMVLQVLWKASSMNLTLVNWVIWHYRFGVHTKEKFIRSKTHLLRFSKTGEYRFYFDKVAEMSDRATKYNDLRTYQKTFTPSGMRPPFDVWEWPRVVGNSKERVKEGPNQVPDELLLRMLDCCTKPGDLVIEGFSGTGSLAEQCVRLDREYRGYDNGPVVSAAAQRRVVNAQEVMKQKHDSSKNA